MNTTDEMADAAANARANGSMRLLMTGGTGVLGRALGPLARAAGHELLAPTKDQLDLFDPVAVAHATHGVDAVASPGHSDPAARAARRPRGMAR